MLPQPRRRWAFFPRSVISDQENPSAHLYRSMARQIAAIEDEARFYEERVNPWLKNMLVQQGARAFRTFQERHPEVTYVTYEPRSGHRLAEWISLALATVDIVVVDSAAPPTIVQWIGELTRPHLHTFLIDPDSRLVTQTDDPSFVAWYRGLCTSDPDVDRIPISPSQYLITFGPALPALGQNGNATTHIDATAASLVDQLVGAVEETLRNDAGDTPRADGHHEPV